MRAGIAPIGDRGSKPLGNAHPPCSGSQEHHAQSDDSQPPSKPAVIFLPPTAGKVKERPVSSVMAGVAREMA
jgi:hypothetical protein